MAKFNEVQKKRRALLSQKKRKLHVDPNTGKLKNRHQPLSISGKRQRKLLKKMEQKDALEKGLVTMEDVEKIVTEAEDLVNVFEVFLPQLLLYPNPSDPLNGEAAALMMRDHAAYDQKVKEYCKMYAKLEDVGATREDEKSSDEELSEDDYGSSDDGIAGHPDP